jgi:xanthine dehydrogenase accessory factor
VQKQLKLWRFIQQQLQDGQPVMLLYVLESIGSSPGRRGFGMAVTAGGDMCGSIGGGMMEHKLVELAKTRFTQSENIRSVHQQIHDKAASKNQSGMICSGEQTVCMMLLQKNDTGLVAQLMDTLEKGENGILQITPSGIHFETKVPEADYYFHINSETDFLYQEKTGFQQHLYIVGGGHCALAFSKLMYDLDFRITIIEERAGLHTLVSNPFAHEVIFVKDYSQTGLYIPHGSTNYVVLMSFGYRTDAVALQSLSDKKLAYLGMLGSRNKIETLFREMNVTRDFNQFATPVHAPIGIPIKSRTPEEIAVSIAAEIIRVKNEKR